MPSYPQLPSHLAGTHAAGWTPGELVLQYEIGSMRNFNYLILDRKKREAAWVDPQKDLTEPLRDLRSEGFTLTSILLTHTHHDHIPGVPGLIGLFPEVNVFVHPEDMHRLSAWPREIRAHLKPVKDGERIRIGTNEVQVLHTPGHSAGECCYYMEARDGRPPFLFTGDTLFIRDCGRTDLPTGDPAQMYESLRRLRRLPGETVILPGHHYAPEVASSLAREIDESPPLRCKSIDELNRLP